MHYFSVASFYQSVASVIESLVADLERDRGGQVATVARQSRYEVSRNVVVYAPHVALQFIFSWKVTKIICHKF